MRLSDSHECSDCEGYASTSCCFCGLIHRRRATAGLPGQASSGRLGKRDRGSRTRFPPVARSTMCSISNIVMVSDSDVWQ